MGRLVEGAWVTGDLGPDAQGRYVRRAAQFRNVLSADGSSGFKAEAGRYHLYLSHACGWSHRVLIARALKGLEGVIGVSYADPFMDEAGWHFEALNKEGPVELEGVTHLYEIYLRHQADYTGRVSVPVLWDTHQKCIVTNESTDLVRSFDSAFEDIVVATPRLFPEGRDAELQAAIDANYRAVNNGVYRAGFAGSQDAHEEAVRELFARFDELEVLLSSQRYLCGDTITAADWCLFPTLYRFDSVYNMHFKCNLRRVQDYPALWGYTRELYQVPGIAATCDMKKTKQHYYRSHESINPRRLVPLGPEIDFEAPHGRDGV